MDKKHRNYRKNVFERVLKTALLVLLSYTAIKLGIAGGNLLFDSNINIVRNIHVETFKSTLNKAVPLINTVYNSGNISVSFSGEMNNFINNIFNFNLDNPVTILNAQSPIMYSFYTSSYQEYLAQEMERDMDKSEHENTDDGSNTDGGSNTDDGGKTDDSKKTDDKTADNAESGSKQTDLLQDQSSIYYEATDELERDRRDDSVVYDGKIAIKNESEIYKVDDALINKLLKEDLKFKFEKKGPQILIYHTHTTESYLRRLSDIGKNNVPSRTQDNRYNVVRVGDELNQRLKKYGFNVMHNGTVNDYVYNDSYVNAGKTVNNILKGNPSIKVVVDLHRDGLNGIKKLRKVTAIKGKNAAQLMFVIGTNHKNWKENFKLALKLHKKMNDKYPGLMLPILLRDTKYNQQVKYGAFIIEVGGDGNTLDEAVESTKYLAEAINEVLGDMKLK